jgi:ribosomal protein S18 acetylase RimI-like enzyme
MTDDVVYEWRGDLTDDEMVELVIAHGGNPQIGWWDRVRAHSLGWVTARTNTGQVVGFVNVAWDGGDHAFLLDTKTRSERQRAGIGTALVSLVVEHAAAAGCEWLHVDFEDSLSAFYFGACGFRSTHAGLIHLYSMST